MNEDFIKSVYKTIVQENKKIYIDLLNNTNKDEVSDEYWKQSSKLYNELSQDRKDVFISIIEQIIVDTVSNMFGIIDGSSTLHGCNAEPKLLLDGNDTEGELQDLFLEYVEDVE